MKITAELHNLIEDNDYIKHVYFTKSGSHYLNVHELKKDGVGTGKFYGSLKLEQVFSHEEANRKFYKLVQVANPPAFIVQTLTRDEILKLYTVQPEVINNSRI